MGYLLETREVTTKTEVVVGAECDNCGAKMWPVNMNKQGEWLSGLLRGLPITLHGHYAGYFDCDRDPRALLCQDCADRLAAAFPFLRKAIAGTQGPGDRDD